MDPEQVDIDLDAAPGDAPRRRARRRPRSWWVVAGLAVLVVGLPGSTVAPSGPDGTAGPDPLPSSQVSSGALRELDLPRRLPPGDVSGDSSWCVVTQKFGGQLISAATPCPSAPPR
jgi:hypothetical protein